jgi:hypothetical protein
MPPSEQPTRGLPAARSAGKPPRRRYAPEPVFCVLPPMRIMIPVLYMLHAPSPAVCSTLPPAGLYMQPAAATLRASAAQGGHTRNAHAAHTATIANSATKTPGELNPCTASARTVTPSTQSMQDLTSRGCALSMHDAVASSATAPTHQPSSNQKQQTSTDAAPDHRLQRSSPANSDNRDSTGLGPSQCQRAAELRWWVLRYRCHRQPA